jgi:WD40 repeat protein
VSADAGGLGAAPVATARRAPGDADAADAAADATPPPPASSPPPPPHGGRVTAIVCPPGSRFIYTASSDGGVRAWEAATLALAASIPAAHAGLGVRCAALGPDGLLYTGGDDGLVRRWRVDGGGAFAGAGGQGGELVPAEDCTEGDPGAPAECWESVLAVAAGVPAAAAGGGGGGGRGGAVVAATAVAAAVTEGGDRDRDLASSLPTSPLVPAPAGALYGHSHPVRALAAGPLDTMVSGDKGGDILVWRV